MGDTARPLAVTRGSPDLPSSVACLLTRHHTRLLFPPTLGYRIIVPTLGNASPPSADLPSSRIRGVLVGREGNQPSEALCALCHTLEVAGVKGRHHQPGVGFDSMSCVGGCYRLRVKVEERASAETTSPVTGLLTQLRRAADIVRNYGTKTKA